MKPVRELGSKTTRRMQSHDEPNWGLGTNLKKKVSTAKKISGKRIMIRSINSRAPSEESEKRRARSKRCSERAKSRNSDKKS